MKPYLRGKFYLVLAASLLAFSSFAAADDAIGTSSSGSLSADTVSSIAENAAKEALSDSNYILQSGDRIGIVIYPTDEYIKGGEMQVSSDGNITLPLIGKVKVSGKTLNQAEDEIAKIVDADYLVNPEVVIEILEYKERSLVILGQVKKPGTVQFPSGETHISLLQAISLAGGFSDIANVKKIKIVRGTGANKQVLQANAEEIIAGQGSDIELEPGDIVHVSESLF